MTAILVVTTGLSACQAELRSPRETPFVVTVPSSVAGERILLDRHQNAFLRYQLATGRILEQTDQPNYFAYEFSSLATTFTAADSVQGGSQVLRRQGNGLLEVHRAPPGEDLLPLADDGTRTFLIQTETATDLARQIVELMPDGSLRRVPGEYGLVYGGALVGERLYVSVYEEKSNDFTLLLIDLSRGGEARVLRTGLRDGRLLLSGDTLYVARGKRLFGAGRTLPCLGLCYFAEGVLLDYRESSRGIPGRGNLLLVRDTVGGTVLARFGRVLDFAVEGRVLSLYTGSGVETARLPIMPRRAPSG